MGGLAPAGQCARSDGRPIWGIVPELAASGLIVLADKGYSGAGQHVITPYKGRNKPPSQKAANRAHAKLRAPGERANAQLKTWRILRKLRCCPWCAGRLAKAMHVLQAPSPRDRRLKKVHLTSANDLCYVTSYLILLYIGKGQICHHSGELL